MDYLRALREPNFRKLWSSQILSQVAQNLLNFALIIQVFNATAGSRFGNVAVSLLVLAFGVPSIFFAAFAGAMVDRWDRRLVMVASNTLRAGLVLLYIPLHHHLLGILLLSFIISSIMQFFVPAEAATIPQVVPERVLLVANSLFVFSLYASFIIGYALASPVIVTLGERGPYILTAAMFALAGAVSLLLPRARPGRSTNLPTFSFMTELKAGYRVVRAHRWISLAIRQLTITQAIVGVIMALAPALSVALLHRPLQDASTYLIVPAGIGMVAGVAMVGQLARRWSKIRVMEVGLIIAGGALILLGLSSLLYRTDQGQTVVSGAHIAFIVATLVFALGMLNAIISSTAQTVLQEHSSEQTRGKVFGALNMFINLAGTFPILLAGLLADLFSVTTFITILGVGVTLLAVVSLWRMRRHGLPPETAA
jgi:MFS family permease